MYNRRLTDAAGGNISARVGDIICITPRYAGSKHLWQLQPEQVMVVDPTGKVLDGVGEISRESQVHFRLLSEFPDAKAVVHGHAQNVMVFCAAGLPIVPVLEDTLKFEEIRVTAFAPAHSASLAEHVMNALRDQEEQIRKQAAAVLVPSHGPFVVGKDLEAAFDALERIDLNAWCILQMTALGFPANKEKVLQASRHAYIALLEAISASPK